MHRRSRRSYRRSPGLFASLKQAGVAGLVNFGARTVQKKTAGLALNFIPQPKDANTARAVTAVVHLVTAGILAVLGERFWPAHADVIAGATVGEGVEQVVMLTPLGPKLSAYVRRPGVLPGGGGTPVRKLAAYVSPRSSMAAYVPASRGRPMPAVGG